MSQEPGVVERALEVTRDVVRHMGIACVVTARESEGSLTIIIHAHESGLLIGRQGATLNALQFLVGLIVNRGQEKRTRIILDAEGYRSRRQASLQAAARRAVEDVLAEGRPVEVETLSSYERRIVHLALVDVPGVITRSEGQGADRRLFVVSDSPNSET